MICLSPGTNSEQSAYSHAIVRITCKVALGRNTFPVKSTRKLTERLRIKLNMQMMSSDQIDLRANKNKVYSIVCVRSPDTDLFQTLTVSPEADRTAMLSELKDTVLASVRWPPRVSRDVLVPVGVFSVVFTVYVSIELFCSNSTTFISPLGDRRQSTDLRKTNYSILYVNVKQSSR